MDKKFEEYYKKEVNKNRFSKDLLALQKKLKQKSRTCEQLFFAGDSNRDDQLTFKEFQKGIAMMGIRPLPREAELKEFFDIYDKNGDGKIQFKELCK